MRRDPLARAVRPDKAILAGVAATLGLYLAGRALLEIPVWQAITRDADALRERAEWIRAQLTGPGRQAVRVTMTESTVGGGALPGQVLASFGIAVAVASPARAAARLRRGPDRVLARVVDDEVVIDLRTVDPIDDGTVARRIAEIAPS
jgi:L-seryl-tRNA(Ser) seleniumtransferase